MTVEYNAEKIGNQETMEGRTGRTGQIPSGDIRHDSFNLGNMHFGPTGADNDNQVPATGVRMSELVEGAKTYREDGPATGEGQQEPKDGKSQNS